MMQLGHSGPFSLIQGFKDSKQFIGTSPYTKRKKHKQVHDHYQKINIPHTMKYIDEMNGFCVSIIF